MKSLQMLNPWLKDIGGLYLGYRCNVVVFQFLRRLFSSHLSWLAHAHPAAVMWNLHWESTNIRICFPFFKKMYSPSVILFPFLAILQNKTNHTQYSSCSVLNISKWDFYCQKKVLRHMRTMQLHISLTHICAVLSESQTVYW